MPSVTHLPNRRVGPGFHEIQLWGLDLFEEADWARVLNTFVLMTAEKEPGAMQRPYLHIEDITLRYDQKTDAYYVYGNSPSVPEEEEHTAIEAAAGRVMEADLRDGPQVRRSIMTFLSDPSYTVLGLYQGRATETGSPLFMIKRTSEPDIFILATENLLAREDEALEQMLMRGAK